MLVTHCSSDTMGYDYTTEIAEIAQSKVTPLSKKYPHHFIGYFCRNLQSTIHRPSIDLSLFIGLLSKETGSGHHATPNCTRSKSQFKRSPATIHSLVQSFPILSTVDRSFSTEK